jgi:hypothetical protein
MSCLKLNAGILPEESRHRANWLGGDLDVMTVMASRKARKAQYREQPPEAGVYRIVNGVSGCSLLGSAVNLPSVGNRLSFAKSTNLPGALDQRIRKDVEAHGIDAFTFEVLETLELRPGMTRDGSEHVYLAQGNCGHPWP